MKKNTKLFFGVCLAIGLAIASTGCATRSIARNFMTTDVNAENYCAITFDRIYKIEIDGKNCRVPNKIFGEFEIIYILPPGNHRIVIEYNADFQNVSGQGDYQGGYTFNRYQVVFEQEFLNRQHYFIYAHNKVINETNPNIWLSPNTAESAIRRREEVEKMLGITN